MSQNEPLDYLIIGAGPAGLQLGLFLAFRGGRLSNSGSVQSPGRLFGHFPRHRKLISINKVHTGYDDPVINLRWDWNSLLTRDHGPLFKDYDRQYFPTADTMVEYLGDFAQQLDLQIQFNTRVTQIRWDEHFRVQDAAGNEFTARSLVVATGCWLPHIPPIPGIEQTECYHDVSIDPEDFAGQRVLILGKGNSAFETADNLIGTTTLIHLASPEIVKLAWQTHHVGHLRAVNNNFLDTYQLKSQNALLDAEVSHIRKEGDEFRVGFRYGHAGGEAEEIVYDRVICCTGFRFDPSIFHDACRPELAVDGRLPAQTSSWESTNTEGLFFAGTLMQARDYKKGQSAFIHGFRYNVRLLSRLLLQRYQGQTLEYDSLPWSADAIAERLLERVNRDSALWQQNGFLCDLIVPDSPQTARYYAELSCDYVHDEWGPRCDEYYTLTLEFGQEHILAAPDIFAIERPHKNDVNRAAESWAIHPIIRRYRRGELVSTHHVIEDLRSEWKENRHHQPLVAYFESQGATHTPPSAGILEAGGVEP